MLLHSPVRFDYTTHQLRQSYPDVSIPVTAPWLGPPPHRSVTVCDGHLPPFFLTGIHPGRFLGEPACSQHNHHLGEGKTPNGPFQLTSGVTAWSRYSPSCMGLEDISCPPALRHNTAPTETKCTHISTGCPTKNSDFTFFHFHFAEDGSNLTSEEC